MATLSLPAFSPRTPARHHRAFGLIGLLGVFVTAAYLTFRAVATLNLAAWYLSLPLFAAECLTFLNGTLLTLQTWDVRSSVAPPPPAPGALSVDVFIPTYNEDAAVLRPTILACRDMRYPHRTYVLDDGRRAWLADLCVELGVDYLTRPDNVHAKAGNLNHALAYTDGDVMAVFDADFIPQPDFLVRTLGYFDNPRVAFVQTPQEFYNLDSLQHAHGAKLDDWNEQTLFYRVIQPGKQRWGAAFWCGCPAVLRRAALADVGGIATETVTEDMHTALRLHARGWEGIYHNEVLALGLAPGDFAGFTTQRLRWAQGAMQLLRGRDNPLFVRGLRPMQRLCYLASLLSWFDGWSLAIAAAVPLVVLATGISPVREVGPLFYAFLAPMLLAQLANLWVRSQGHPWRMLQQSVLRMPSSLQATARLLLTRALPFRVTPKGVTRVAPVREVLPLIILAILAGLGTLWGLFLLVSGRAANPQLIAISAAWTALNATYCGLAARSALAAHSARSTYRFPVTLPVTLMENDTLRDATTRDMSVNGARLRVAVEVATGTRTSILFDLDDGTAVIGLGSVVWCAVAEGGYDVGVQIEQWNGADVDRILAYLHTVVAVQQVTGQSVTPLRRRLRAAGALAS